jgi:hypothetical protein
MKMWSALTALCLAIVATINLVQAVRHVPPPPVAVPGRPPANIVLRQEERFAAARRALETRGIRGPIGYVADLAPPHLSADHRSMEDYFSAQFILAPCILDPKVGDRRWAIANLRTRTLAERLPAGFTVAEDFGGGVLLLRKGPP